MGTNAVWEQDQRPTEKWSGQGQTSQTGDAAFAPPFPPFLLVQNLSSKWIVPSGNMQPKLDDANGIISG